jgi:hypothetical protein
MTQAAKRKILGLNAAHLYGIPGAAEASHKGRYRPVPSNFSALIPNQLKTLLEFPGFSADNFSKLRQRYVESGGGRSNTRYGWIRTKA